MSGEALLERTLHREGESYFEWLSAKLRYGGPDVMIPTTRPNLPTYTVDYQRLRPVWRVMPPRLIRSFLDPVFFWQAIGEYEGEKIRFDPWQRLWLWNRNRFRCVEKAPQIGFSWLSALEALHEVLLFQDATAGFVSVDMREATEKILYARKAYYELPAMLQDWIPLIRDAVDQLDFGDEGRRSRLMSLPATAGVRGRKMSVYLDEIDFYRDGGRDTFRAAMGRVARGGRVTVGSTAFGVDTQLDKLMQGNERVFSRARLPWTVVENPDQTSSIEMALSELDDEDAAEEYECLRGGSTTDTFSPGLILQQTHDQEPQDPAEWEPGGPCVAGYDVGKSRHPSILSIIERGSDKVWRQAVLYQPKDDRGDNMTLPKQHDFLRSLMKKHKTLTLVLDIAGIGAQIGQAMEAEFGSRFIPMYPGSKPQNHAPQDKVEMVTEIKRGLEANELQLCMDREQANQFRKTRKRPNGQVDQPGTSRRSHYDRFWSTTYAWYGASSGNSVQSVYNTKKLIIIGG